MQWKNFFLATFDISASARLGKVSLRSPSPSLGMFFFAVIGPDFYIICTLFLFQSPNLLCRKLLRKTTPSSRRVIQHMSSLCLRAINQLSGLEEDLYFGDHDVCKMRHEKSDSQMIFSAEHQMFILSHL